MAKMVKNVHFVERGRRSKYDWPRWFNGAIWELKRGEDFENCFSFRSAAYQMAGKRGGKLRSMMSDDASVIVIQFYKG